MDLTSQKERWALWSVQASGFAKRQNFPDAVARMKLVQRSVADALAAVTDKTAAIIVEPVQGEGGILRASRLLSDRFSRLPFKSR